MLFRSLLMGNTARVDVTKPVEEQGAFPEFVRDVLPVAQQAVLEEGDLLFMPPGSVSFCSRVGPMCKTGADHVRDTGGGTR